MRTPVLASVFALSSIFAATTASAQDPTPPPTTTPATGAAPAAPSAATPATAPAPSEAPPLSDEDADAQGRLWIGFNVGGGVGTGANISGPAFDASFRAGWVLNHLMGVYGNLTGLVWVGAADSASNGGGSVSLGAITGWLITPMFALTPADIFEVSVGPSLDFLSGGSASESVSQAGGGSVSASASAFSGAYFGAEVRAALHLGGRNKDTRRRRGFTLSADVHPSFVSGGPVTFITGGLGADWF